MRSGIWLFGERVADEPGAGRDSARVVRGIINLEQRFDWSTHLEKSPSYISGVGTVRIVALAPDAVAKSLVGEKEEGAVLAVVEFGDLHGPPRCAPKSFCL